MKLFINWKDDHSVARNLFILFFCIWMFIIGLIVGYSLNSTIKDQMLINECVKDNLCYTFYNQTGSLSKNDYIMWLIGLIDEHKLAKYNK